MQRHDIDLRRRFLEHPEEFVRVKEAKDIVLSSESTIRRWCREGDIEYLKLGGRIQIWKPSLEDMIKEPI
jgi:predicted site-specific integrase-resolvase